MKPDLTFTIIGALFFSAGCATPATRGPVEPRSSGATSHASVPTSVFYGFGNASSGRYNVAVSVGRAVATVELTMTQDSKPLDGPRACVTRVTFSEMEVKQAWMGRIQALKICEIETRTLPECVQAGEESTLLLSDSIGRRVASASLQKPKCRPIVGERLNYVCGGLAELKVALNDEVQKHVDFKALSRCTGDAKAFFR